MLITVIIFLREALEAALLISALLAGLHRVGYSKNWILPAIVCGLLGGGIMAYFLEGISNMFEGAGQEVVNSLFLIGMVLLLNFTCIWIAKTHYQNLAAKRYDKSDRSIVYILSALVAIAITHEGSELAIFSYAAIHGSGSIVPLIAGAIIGIGIGMSVGAIFYYLLIHIPRPISIKITIALLILIAAGMALQAATYLIQVNWLPSQLPVWNSSFIIEENSLAGQLLYALIGYEATPSAIQLGFYVTTVACLLISLYLVYRRQGRLSYD